jgi:hypothetical protein
LIEDFKKLSLADGQITELAMSVSECKVYFQDWQEQKFCFSFDDVIGIEIFSIFDEDLSHATVSSTDGFVQHSGAIANDKIEDLWCFTFWSARSEVPLMRVVARDFKALKL